MLFRYDLYPAELLKAIIESERKGEDTLEGVKSLLTSLIINDTQDVPETFSAIASTMIGNARKRSETYKRNAMMRDYSRKPTGSAQKPESDEAVEEKGDGEKQAQGASKPQKKAIDAGGFVKVTDDEYSQLVAKYGTDLDGMVEILSAYKESTGKRYKSDAGALRGWVRREWEDRKRKAGAKSFKAQERERDAMMAGSLLTEEQRRQYGL